MNETLKRRLVGAAVLIAVGVLVPVLLVKWLQPEAPPAGESVRVYEITPSGQARPVKDEDSASSTSRKPSNPAQAKDETKASLQTQADSEPAAKTAATAKPERPQKPISQAEPKPESQSEPEPPKPETAKPAARPAQPEPAKTPEAQPKPSNKTASTAAQGESWVVQVGSFTQEKNAMQLMRKLSGSYPSFYREGEVNKVVHYRVRVGPYPDQDAAEAAAGKLRKQGLGTQVQRAD